MGNDKRNELFIAALGDREEIVKSAAAEAIERLEVRCKIDAIAERIEKGEMLDKLRAVYAISDLKGARVYEILTKAMKDPLEDVRAAVLRVLGEIGDVSLLPVIVEALKDPSTTVQRVAIEALRSYKDARLLGPMMQLLKNPDPGVVERALEIIAFIGDKKAEEAMFYFAAKGNPKMRATAIRALGMMER